MSKARMDWGMKRGLADCKAYSLNTVDLVLH